MTNAPLLDGALAVTTGKVSPSVLDPDTAAALPRRVRMTRRAPWRHLAPGAVIVDRRGRWGNPYAVKVYGRERAIELYRGHLAEHSDLAAAVRRELSGRDLACWCPLDQPCHADVLLKVANGGVR